MRSQGFGLRVAALFVGFLLAGARVSADDLREGDQIWAMTALQGGFGWIDPKLDRVKGYLELQGRWRGFGQSLDTAFLPRFALGYAINHQVTVFAGFADVVGDPANHVASGRPSRDPFRELRPYEQITWDVPVEGFTLQSRTRLEQRIIHDNLGWRLREFVKATVDVPGSNRLYLAAYDELFFDLDDTSRRAGHQHKGFRQNRAFAGLGYHVDPKKHGSIEVGYLNQWLNPRNADRANHVLSLNLFLNY